MLFLEGFLKKLGFDVDSIRSEAALAEKVLAFAPHLVLSTGEGKKINGNRVHGKLNNNCQLILLFPRNKLNDEKFTANYFAQAMEETPVNPPRLLKAICSVTGLEEDTVLEKYQKLGIAQGSMDGDDQEMQVVSGKVGSQGLPLVDPKEEKRRVKKYADLIAELPDTPEVPFDKAKVKAAVEDNQKNADDDSTKELNQQRKDFVKALAKKH